MGTSPQDSALTSTPLARKLSPMSDRVFSTTSFPLNRHFSLSGAVKFWKSSMVCDMCRRISITLSMFFCISAGLSSSNS